jgi:hypothetical protein
MFMTQTQNHLGLPRDYLNGKEIHGHMAMAFGVFSKLRNIRE